MKPHKVNLLKGAEIFGAASARDNAVATARTSQSLVMLQMLWAGQICVWRMIVCGKVLFHVFATILCRDHRVKRPCKKWEKIVKNPVSRDYLFTSGACGGLCFYSDFTPLAALAVKSLL